MCQVYRMIHKWCLSNFVWNSTESSSNGPMRSYPSTVSSASPSCLNLHGGALHWYCHWVANLCNLLCIIVSLMKVMVVGWATKHLETYATNLKIVTGPRCSHCCYSNAMKKQIVVRMKAIASFVSWIGQITLVGEFGVLERLPTAVSFAAVGCAARGSGVTASRGTKKGVASCFSSSLPSNQPFLLKNFK